jgi:hypothetical protein
MHTQTLETSHNVQPQIFNTLNTQETDLLDLSDLQTDYRAHQKALLKELHIKDKTHALRDPATYFKLLTWQVVERCFDRIVWTEARPTHQGRGYSTSAHCAVFRTNSVGHMEPTFWAKVSYRTQIGPNGRPCLDGRSNPLLEPDAHTVETDLQGLKRRDNIQFRLRQAECSSGIRVEAFQYMGRAVLLDELDGMRYLDAFGHDVLTVVHELDQRTPDQRVTEDHLAYIATHHLVHGSNL